MRYLAHKLQIQALVNSYSKLIKRTMPKAIKKRHEKIGFNEKLAAAMVIVKQNSADFRLLADLPSLVEEFEWLSQAKPGVVFPENIQLCEHLLKARFDIDQFENTLFDIFMLMMPRGFKIDGEQVPGVLVTWANEEQRKHAIANFGQSTNFDFDNSQYSSDRMLSIVYKPDASPCIYRATIPEPKIPQALRASNSIEYSIAIGGVIRDQQPLNPIEAEFQRKLFRLIMALIVYCKALPDQVEAGLTLKSDNPHIKQINNNSLVIHEHVEPKKRQQSESPFYRSWHFATLRHPKYYQGEYSNLQPGSRVVFRRAAMVGRETESVTVKEMKYE